MVTEEIVQNAQNVYRQVCANIDTNWLNELLDLVRKRRAGLMKQQ